MQYISAGCRHGGAVTEDGKLFMWGFNFYEQLGLGESERDKLHPSCVRVGEVYTVSCGYFHTGALVKE